MRLEFRLTNFAPAKIRSCSMGSFGAEVCPILLLCLGFADTAPAAGDPSQVVRSAIEWRTDYKAALREAACKKKPLFIYTTFSTCFWAHKMESEILADRRIESLVNEQFIPVKIYAERDPDVIDSYHVHTFPTTIICSSEGRVLQSIEAYAAVARLLPELTRAASVKQEWDLKVSCRRARRRR
jgi:thioredoxin-related protein